MNSYSSENLLLLHNQKCENNDRFTIRSSSESHLPLKNHFQKNSLYIRIYADFEADSEKDHSSIGNKTTNFYKENPVPTGYHIESELEDFSKSGYHKSPLGYDIVDWFANEVIKLENKMTFFFKNTKKDIIITEKDEEDYRNNNNCSFCEKFIETDKVRDHCQLTGKYRGAAHNNCSIFVTQKQSNFIPFIFHNFSDYYCHLFFKKLVAKKNDKVKFDIIPKTNQENKSKNYGCIRFIDSYRFLWSSVASLVKTLVDNSHETLKNLKEEIVDNDEIINIVRDIEEDRTIQDLKKDYPDKFIEIEEILLNFMVEIDLKIIKIGFPDKWKYLTKKFSSPIWNVL